MSFTLSDWLSGPLSSKMITANSTPGAGATTTDLNMADGGTTPLAGWVASLNVTRGGTGTISKLQIMDVTATNTFWEKDVAVGSQDIFVDMSNPVFLGAGINAYNLRVTHSATAASPITANSNNIRQQ